MPIIRKIMRDLRIKALFGDGPNPRGGVGLEHEGADVPLHVVAPLKLPREIHVERLVPHVMEGLLELQAVGVEVCPFLNEVGRGESEDS